MTHPSLSAYLASAHQHDLIREAEHAALVGEALQQTPSRWSRAIQQVADLLIDTGHLVKSRLAQTKMTTARNAQAPAFVHSQHAGHGLSGHEATEARSWLQRVGPHVATSTCTLTTTCCCVPRG